jgi:hypothetical protein
MADLDDSDDLPEEDLSMDDGEPNGADADDGDDDLDVVDGDDEDIDGLLDELGSGPDKPGDARRRIEEYLEMKRAARELSDLDAYDFD